jgi:hypothetical protein
MSLLAATTVAALLIANPSATEIDRVAANGGFLIGNAHRCGVDPERVVRAGQVVRDLIVAEARDSKEQEDATGRFASFFLVSAVPAAAKDKLVASCQLVAQEFAEFEKHSTAATVGMTSSGQNFRPEDGK